MEDELCFDISNENRLLLCCAQTRISEEQRVCINDLVALPLDWNMVSRSAYETGLETLLYSHLKDIPNRRRIPDEFMEMVKKAYHENIARNMFLYYELQRILEFFRSKRIKAILLKGAALAKFMYGDIGLRSMSDLDILVKQEDLDKTKEIMLRLDYISEKDRQEEPNKTKEHHHIPVYKHREKNIVVEIHWNISESSLGIEMKPWWKRAQPVKLNACDVLIPSPEDMIIHLCIHLYNHGYDNRIFLRNLCDINETLRNHREDINWNLLRNLTEEYSIHKQVYSVLSLIRKLYDFDDVSHGWISQYNIDINFLAILNKRIFISQDSLYGELSPNLLKFLKISTMAQRMKMLFQKGFPSRDVISKTYSITTDQKKIYFYQVFHPFFLLLKHGKFIFSVYRIKN